MRKAIFVAAVALALVVEGSAQAQPILFVTNGQTLVAKVPPAGFGEFKLRLVRHPDAPFQMVPAKLNFLEGCASP